MCKLYITLVAKLQRPEKLYRNGNQRSIWGFLKKISDCITLMIKYYQTIEYYAFATE